MQIAVYVGRFNHTCCNGSNEVMVSLWSAKICTDSEIITLELTHFLAFFGRPAEQGGAKLLFLFFGNSVNFSRKKCLYIYVSQFMYVYIFLFELLIIFIFFKYTYTQIDENLNECVP